MHRHWLPLRGGKTHVIIALVFRSAALFIHISCLTPPPLINNIVVGVANVTHRLEAEDLARKQLDEISHLTNEVKALRKDLMDRDERKKHNVNCIVELQKERRAQNERMECQREASEKRAKALECCIGV